MLKLLLRKAFCKNKTIEAFNSSIAMYFSGMLTNIQCFKVAQGVSSLDIISAVQIKGQHSIYLFQFQFQTLEIFHAEIKKQIKKIDRE